MNTLYLLRHSLTEANERHLYGGSTDIPLSEKGRQIANERGDTLPHLGLYISSGMQRADETLLLMTGRQPDLRLAGLREMDFGEFEMRSYDELKDIPEYIRWISDPTDAVRCPGGESRGAFRRRVLEAGERLLNMDADTACAVCHGGAIVFLMEAWFPRVERHFYEWQPGPCGGYRVSISEGRATAFKEV